MDQEALKTLIRQAVRDEICKAEKRILEKLQEHIPRKRRRVEPQSERSAKEALSSELGISRSLASILMKAVYAELHFELEIQNVPGVSEILKPARDVDPRALQWAARSKSLAIQRKHTREQKRDTELDKNQALLYWCKLVKIQCIAGANKDFSKLPQGCRFHEKPRYGSKICTQVASTDKMKLAPAERR